MIARRTLLSAAGLLLAGPALAQRREAAEVWRDPNCGCCGAWVQHLRTEGFTVTDRVVPSVTPYRQMLRTPADLLSCHAARVAGVLAIEGHVPAAAIRRAVAERAAGIIGLAVPGMPVGSPGMEVPGQAPDAYNVVLWREDGTHAPFMRFVGATPA